MMEKRKPPVLRAVRVREGLALVSMELFPCAACEAVLRLGDAQMLLGAPRAGWLSAVVHEETLGGIPDTCRCVVRTGIRIADVYGMAMQDCCTEVLRVLADAGAELLGVSLCTQRLSAAYAGDAAAAPLLYQRFPFEL